MGGELVMNSSPHPKDRNVIAVGIGHSNVLLEINRKGLLYGINCSELKTRGSVGGVVLMYHTWCMKA